MKLKRRDVHLRPPIYAACLKASEKFSVSVPVFLLHALEHLLGVETDRKLIEVRNLNHVRRATAKTRKRARIREVIKKGIDPYAPTAEEAALERARKLLKKHGKL
jgi:hypothetical protein